jgi:hypothetical protein
MSASGLGFGGTDWKFSLNDLGEMLRHTSHYEESLLIHAKQIILLWQTVTVPSLRASEGVKKFVGQGNRLPIFNRPSFSKGGLEGVSALE